MACRISSHLYLVSHHRSEFVTALRAGDIFKALQRSLSEEWRLMDHRYLLNATTRREILRAATFLAGGSALAGLMPRTLLAESQAAAAGKPQTPSSAPTDPVEQM